MLITCTSCQSMIRVPDDAAGKKGKCPKCATVLTIPGADESPGYAAAVPPSLPATSSPPVSRPTRRYHDDEDDEARRRYGDDDDDDIGIRRRRRVESAGMSIAALVLGGSGLIVVVAALVGSFLLTAGLGPQGCCWSVLGGYAALALSGLLGVLGIIFGAIGRNQGGRAYAWSGIVTGILSVVVVIACLLLTFLGFLAVLGIGAAAVQQQQHHRNFVPR